MKRRIGFEIGRTSRLIRRHLDSSATKTYIDNLTGTHGRAIGFFWHNRDKDIFQRDFEQEFNIRRSTASSMLTLMEKNGLIARQSVPYDARLKKIVLTDKALEIQNFVNKNLDEFEEGISRGISNEELEVFFGVLEKIRENLNNPDGKVGIKE